MTGKERSERRRDQRGIKGEVSENRIKSGKGTDCPPDFEQTYAYEARCIRLSRSNDVRLLFVL